MCIREDRRAAAPGAATPHARVTPVPAAGAHDEARSLLAACGLPIDDLDDPGVRLFATRSGRTLDGVVGLQWLDAGVLLRSLAVAPGARERGVARGLVAFAEDEAIAGGAVDIHLLTSSAAPFFERLGYVPVDRAAAPPAVVETRQFASLCPASAVLLRKALTPRQMSVPAGPLPGGVRP